MASSFLLIWAIAFLDLFIFYYARSSSGKVLCKNNLIDKGGELFFLLKIRKLQIVIPAFLDAIRFLKRTQGTIVVR